MPIKFDTVYTEYHDAIESLPNYTANEKINDEKYSPRATADKQFFLEFVDSPAVEEGMSSGNKETRSLRFNLKILFSYPGKNTYAVNEAATLALIDAVIVVLYSVSFEGYINIAIDNVSIGPLNNGYKLCTIPFEVSFAWSTI